MGLETPRTSVPVAGKTGRSYPFFDSSPKAIMVCPRAPVDSSNSLARAVSRASTSASTSHAAISSSLAPTKHNSQTPTASEPQLNGGPKVRQGAAIRVKRRTRFVIGEAGEPLLGFLAFGQHAGDRVAGEIGRETGHRLACTLANPIRPLRIPRRKFSQPDAQPPGIHLTDGKWTDAALRAAQAADQPIATPARGFGQRGVHNLKERTVA